MFHQERPTSSFSNNQNHNNNVLKNIASNLLHSMMASSPASLLAHYNHLNNKYKSPALLSSRGLRQNNTINNATGSGGAINIRNILASSQDSESQQVTRMELRNQNHFDPEALNSLLSGSSIKPSKTGAHQVMGGKTSVSSMLDSSPSSQLSLSSKPSQEKASSSSSCQQQSVEDLSSSNNKKNIDSATRRRGSGTKRKSK